MPPHFLKYIRGYFRRDQNSARRGPFEKRFTPTLEELEPRTAPAVWLVNSIRDSSVGGVGGLPGELRTAVNNAASGDTISINIPAREPQVITLLDGAIATGKSSLSN